MAPKNGTDKSIVLFGEVNSQLAALKNSVEAMNPSTALSSVLVDTGLLKDTLAGSLASLQAKLAEHQARSLEDIEKLATAVAGVRGQLTSFTEELGAVLQNQAVRISRHIAETNKALTEARRSGHREVWAGVYQRAFEAQLASMQNVPPDQLRNDEMGKIINAAAHAADNAVRLLIKAEDGNFGIPPGPVPAAPVAAIPAAPMNPAAPV